MAYNSQENAVENTFVKAQDQINKMQKVFRDEGLLAKAVVDIGGNQDFRTIQEAFDNLYGALEDAHYDAFLGASGASMHGESEEKTVNEDDEQALMRQLMRRDGLDPDKVSDGGVFDKYREMAKKQLAEDDEIQAIPAKVVELAGDSIWDRDGSNPKSVKVSKVSILDPYGGSDPYMADDEDDGYRKVDVEHDGPWSIYTDSGFEKAISKMVGFEVTFTEQGMQQDGMASMEGTMGDAMESVNVTEGYEGKVLSILKKEGIGAYFSGGKLYIDQADMAEAKSALADNDDIKELPDMVAEAHKDDCGCDACAEDDKKMTADDELQLLLKRAGLR